MAAAHVLNKLSADSEIIVMNAAGVSPWRLLWPFLAAAIVVSLLVAGIAAYVSPRSLRALRDWGAQVRADILTNIVQPGRFTTVSGNLTFHIADRRPNGLLVGIFVDDRRDPKEHATYLAEQGEIVKNDTARSSCMEGGSIQRVEAGERDPRIVDVRPLRLRSVEIHRRHRKTPTTPCARNTSGSCCGRGPTTRSMWRSRTSIARNCTIAWRPRSIRWPSSSWPSRFLGPPQTTRQSRTLALLGMIGAVSLLRLVGFVSVIVGVRVPGVLPFNIVALFGAIVVGMWQISRGRAMEPAAAVSKIATAIGDRIARATSVEERR